MKNTVKAHLALLITTLIFGLHYVIAKKMMLTDFQPMQLLFLRLLGGTLLFWITGRFFVREKIDKRDLRMLALCGAFGFTLNQALFYEGLRLTNPVDASIIHVMNPVFVLIIASILIKEKVTWMKIAGIAMGASGALILILYGRKFDLSSNTMLGNILVVSNMLFYALYLVLIKPLVAKYNNITILKWVSLFGLLFILPFSVEGMLTFHPQMLSVQSWWMLAYIILLCTYVAYLLINYALKYVEASTASFFTYLQPFIASVTSISIGGESITLPKIIAACLIFGGVFLVNRREKPQAIGNRH